MPHAMTARAPIPCRLSRPAVVCPLGDTPAAIEAALFQGQRGLVDDDALIDARTLPVGRVATPLPDDSAWPAQHRSRNNRLLAAALTQLAPTLEAFRQCHPDARIGVVIGTSTSGIGETERHLGHYRQTGQWPEAFHYQRQEIGASARFIAERLGLDGPAYTLSTACTSSARALTSARRLLASGRCDAVIAGGADSLCRLTVNGFAALGALSDAPCEPFSVNRRGINIGEAAALFLVTRETGGIQLSGYGETSDAHHISAPKPDGAGAQAAMEMALEMASLTPGEVDYINLHGTATRLNDSMEALAVAKVFGEASACRSIPACSSTKALTGHTLGACGALEAAFCWLAMQAERLPPQVNDGHIDPQLAPLRYATADTRQTCRRAISNAFAFGGNNISLLLERAS